MFTVIIAEKRIIDLYKEFSPFVKPLLNDEIVFCQWNRDGKSVDQMLPEIYRITEFHKQWRAIIVNQDGLSNVNPFDYTQYKDPHAAGTNKTLNWQRLDDLRKARFGSFDTATENPLTRLTSALCGPVSFNYQVENSEVLHRIVEGEMPLYEYMLRSQLRDLNLQETAMRLDTYLREALQRFVTEDSVDLLIDAVRQGDAKAVTSYVASDMIVDFIKLIGDNDLLHSDPDYNERLVENSYKAELLTELNRRYCFVDRLPEEVICFSPRTFDYENYMQGIEWNGNDESDYSRFAEFNLYHDKLRYMVFDLVSPEHKQYLSDELRMISFLLILAANELPKSVMKAQRVYRVDLQMDEGAIKTVFSEYLGKLKATSQSIRETALDIDREYSGHLDRRTSQELFESEVSIPVEITEYSRDEMYAEYNKIGLSCDCPEDEYSVWRSRFRSIEKQFVRYMREPQRVLKAAARNDFRAQNRIDDERVQQLDDNQKEDIELKMLEEEQEMVASSTPQIFQLDGYKKKMRKADEELCLAIKQRMTRRRTILVGAVSAAAYLFGFLPLIFSNLNKTKSFLWSLGISLAAIAVLMIIGIVFLIVLRGRMTRRYKHFNDVMNEIFRSVESGLAVFSTYLSHACNVMRENSVLHVFGSKAVTKKRILSLHNTKICDTADEAVAVFSKFIDCDSIEAGDAEAYDNDYTVIENYDYPIPYSELPRSIDYLQKGNKISVAADYVVSVTLDRVELYD
ncbi:MAG: hypothetical protein K6G90_10055 [Clostridia bacterium]|nr:hypothetical protein [Clostridia bacterium]